MSQEKRETAGLDASCCSGESWKNSSAFCKGATEKAGEANPSQAKASCPCKSFFKGHRLAVFGALAVVATVFLISQVGGILAFVRTF